MAARRELHLADLAEETIILPESGSLTERVVRTAQCKHNVEFPRTMRMTTFPLMCEAVLQGAGVAIFLSNSGLISNGLVEISIAELSDLYETSVITPKDRARLRLVESFVSIAAAV